MYFIVAIVFIYMVIVTLSRISKIKSNYWVEECLKHFEYNKSTNKRKRINIMLVIAHPDDEAMFFVPTIRSILENRSKFNLYLCCFSTGMKISCSIS